MFKKITFSLFVVLISLPSHSQTYLGARWGYSISNLYISNQETLTIQGFNYIDAGIIVKYYDLKYIGLQLEANVTQRGYQKSIGEVWEQYRRINTYLDVPFMMQLRFSSNGLFLHLQGGSYAAFLIGAVHGDNINPNRIFNLTPYTINILNDNRFDFGVIGGIGVGYDSRWGTIQFEGRFLFGFLDLYKGSELGDPARSNSYFINITAMYLINLSNISSSSSKVQNLMQ